MSHYSDAVFALSPTSYWRYEAGALTDSGTAAITLTTTGTPAQTASIVPSENALAGEAYGLPSGVHYFTGTNAYSFTGEIDWTIKLWMRIDNATFGSGNSRLIVKKDTTGDFPGWTFQGQNVGELAFYIDFGATTESAIFAAGLQQGTTYFLLLTWVDSTTTLSLYVNGTLFGSDSTWTIAPGFPATTASFRIGASESGGSNFVGAVDDVAVWSGTALTAANATTLWEAGQSRTVTVGVPQPKFGAF